MFIPCVSNRPFTFEQLLIELAAVASAPCTSVGVVDDIATFCAAAIVIIYIENDNIISNFDDFRVALGNRHRLLMLDHILSD